MPVSVENEDVFYEVATLEPPAVGFLVCRIDLTKTCDGGLEAIAISEHATRDEADAEAMRLAGRSN